MQLGGSGALDPGSHKGGKAVSHCLLFGYSDIRKIKEQNTFAVITLIRFVECNSF